MSVRPMSPGGALLRRSKVFAMPPPLTGTEENKFVRQPLAKTATTPYPTHISLTTPLSSLKEGDWGLKRPLPIRITTKSSSPSVRIEAIDTLEQITSFRSSGDHAITLEKWQELGLPITSEVVYSNDANPTRRSVFEDDLDNIEIMGDESARYPGRMKWKFKGPWLAGQNNGEFSEYMKTSVEGRKEEFKDYLRIEYAKSKTADARKTFIAEGLDDKAPITQPEKITDEEIFIYIKQLRYNKQDMNRLIRSFLDIPHAGAHELAESIRNVKRLTNHNEISDTGRAAESVVYSHNLSSPSRTHPSAGLSYNRTYAHMFNHPLYGPQKFKSPVQARVILPKFTNNMGPRKPVIGCVGFTVAVPASMDPKNVSYTKGFKMSSQFNMSRFPGLQYLETQLKNGSKSWIHPKHAEIDSNGHLQLSWDIADPEAVAIKTNTVHELKNPIEPEKTQYWKKFQNTYNAIPKLSDASTYGLDSMLPSEMSTMDDSQAISELGSLMNDTRGAG